MPAILTPNPDEAEAELEALEFNKYLLAKSFFDCREFDRCTAVFLPDSLLSSILSPRGEESPLSSQNKGKQPLNASTYRTKAGILPEISQKSLFLALYAKMLSGEKRKDEDSEMVMGPQDIGSVTNKQLPVIGRYLKTWFEERQGSPDDITHEGSQGWLEYLYGIVLAKEKNTEEALQWFLRSVHLFPMNWGCWLEMTSSITRVELVGQKAPDNDEFTWLTIHAAQQNNTSLTTAHRFLHVPHTYVFGTLPTDDRVADRVGTASGHFPQLALPPHLFGSLFVPYQSAQRSCYRVQPFTFSTSTSARQSRYLLQHPLRAE